MKLHRISLCLGWLALAGSTVPLHGQTTAFTYQGRLDYDGFPANGTFDLTFWLYSAFSGGSPVASNSVVGRKLDNGLFTAQIDFGNHLVSGRDAWLGISIATNGTSDFALLSPRTRLTPTPRALFATVAGSVTNGGIRVEQLAAAGVPAPGQVLGFDGTSFAWQAPGGGSSAWLLNGSNLFYNAGRVGVGTTVPFTRLEVSAPVIGDGISVRGAAPAFILGDTNAPRSVFGYAGLAGLYSTDAAAGDSVLRADTGRLLFQTGIFGAGLALNNNRVGIGTTTPGKKLTVAGDMEIGVNSADYRHLRIGGGNSDGFLYGSFLRYGDGVHLGYNYYADAAGADRIIRPDGGTSRITATYGYIGLLTAGPGEGAPAKGLVVDPSGGVTVDGSISVASVTIRGGADLAEPFPMKEEMEKGSVVVIDDEHPGRLKLSTRAYDTQVAGIVSGANGINPGIALKQEGVLDQGQNVALSGRVYVKADAARGAIRPGDLLTTSDTPGHAMKVADGARAQGAILGKAMTALDRGTGLVLVLVTLQ